jgi:hypothetical protein
MRKLSPNEKSHMLKATTKKGPYIAHATASRVIRHALLRLSVIGLLLALPLTRPVIRARFATPFSRS